MPREVVGRTGLKLSQLKAKGKPENPFAKKKGSGEFPSLEETDFLNPKSKAMARGTSLPRRKSAPLEMEFGSVSGPERKSPKRKSLPLKGLDPTEVY
jgi:hypothetical protein